MSHLLQPGVITKHKVRRRDPDEGNWSEEHQG
jgi:hypothetical protein